MSTIWALPNFSGELFTASARTTPILSMAGGLGNGKITNTAEFAIASNFVLPAGAQPARTENQALGGVPAANNFVRNQDTNVVQIHHESVILSYHKTGSKGTMSGINQAGQMNNAENELAFQQARTLEKIARDVETSFIQGVYNRAGNANQANQTRGLVAACALAGGTAVPGGGVQLTLVQMQTLFRTMYENGAVFDNVVLNVTPALKQRISALYGFAPTDRTVGGVAIDEILTDFGRVGIVPNRFMRGGANECVLAVEMSVVSPVFLEIPGKGILFYEETAKIGAGEYGQMYGEIGLDYGANYYHGVITNVIA
jgi:hypothetical protein